MKYEPFDAPYWSTQLGAETFALAQQGVLTDFSMGYNVVSEHLDNGDRIADSIEWSELL